MELYDAGNANDFFLGMDIQAPISLIMHLIMIVGTPLHAVQVLSWYVLLCFFYFISILLGSGEKCILTFCEKVRTAYGDWRMLPAAFSSFSSSFFALSWIGKWMVSLQWDDV